MTNRLRVQRNRPAVGTVRWGQLRQPGPDSLHDIERVYTSDFIARHGASVRGRVLFAGDSTSTGPAAGDSTHCEVLKIAPGVTPDLTPAAYDCVILAQATGSSAVSGALLEILFRALRPGGVMLATLPAVTQVQSPGSTWHFTELSARRVWAAIFGSANVVTESYGNLLAATASLNDFGHDALEPEELWHADPGFPVVIAVFAVKPASTGTDAIEVNASQPLVTVIMTFLNAASYIHEAVNSVLVQSYRNWELLLVDDGSTDGSTRCAQQLCAAYPGRIRYFHHAGHSNRGISASRNLGTQQARGEYVAFLDADDVWLPHKLERQVALLQSRPDVDLLYNIPLYWYGWTGKADDAARDYVPDSGFDHGDLFCPPEILLQAYPLGSANALGPSGLILRRQMLLDLGGFEEASPAAYEDQAFLAKAYLHAKVLVSNELWYRYRMHQGSVSTEVAREGNYEAVRLWFLEWFQSYIGCIDVPRQVRGAVAAALLRYRHPRIHALHDQVLRGLRGLAAVRQRIGAAAADGKVRAHWRRVAGEREHRLKDRRVWIRQLTAGRSWWEGQANRWERIAQQRGTTLEELRAWTREVELGKQWLEAEWHQWRSLAEERQMEVDRLTGRLAEIEASRH